MVYEVMGQHTISAEENAIEQSQQVMGQHRKSKHKSMTKRSYIRKKIRIVCDEKIRLTITNTARFYPKEFRLITAEVEV